MSAQLDTSSTILYSKIVEAKEAGVSEDALNRIKNAAEESGSLIPHLIDILTEMINKRIAFNKREKKFASDSIAEAAYKSLERVLEDMKNEIRENVEGCDICHSCNRQKNIDVIPVFEKKCTNCESEEMYYFTCSPHYVRSNNSPCPCNSTTIRGAYCGKCKKKSFFEAKEED